MGLVQVGSNGTFWCVFSVFSRSFPFHGVIDNVYSLSDEGGDLRCSSVRVGFLALLSILNILLSLSAGRERISRAGDIQIHYTFMAGRGDLITAIASHFHVIYRLHASMPSARAKCMPLFAQGKFCWMRVLALRVRGMGTG